jgi:DNA repair ATPase RecN
MTSTSSLPNLGAPSTLFSDTGDFVLQNINLIHLQVYSAEVKKLSSSVAIFQDQQLNPEAQKLIASVYLVYDEMEDDVASWDRSYQDIVRIASDNYQSTQIFNTYLTNLKTLAPQLGQGDLSTSTLTRFNKLVQVLQQKANENQNRAIVLATSSIQDYLQREYTKNASQLETVRQNFINALNNLPDISPEIKQLKSEIYAAQKLVEAANEKYEKAALSAKLAVTYAWIPLVGWIVAAVVGVQATQQMNEASDEARKQADIIKAKSEQLEELEAQQGEQQKLWTMFRKLAVEKMVSKTQKATEELEEVVSLLQKIGDAWQSVGPELATLRNLATQTSIADVDFNIAIDQWKDFGTKANQWRMTAFVSFS